jgi:hypothetical protein
VAERRPSSLIASKDPDRALIQRGSADGAGDAVAAPSANTHKIARVARIPQDMPYIMAWSEFTEYHVA